eukprot:2971863-Rhodomonas_salina.1
MPAQKKPARTRWIQLPRRSDPASIQLPRRVCAGAPGSGDASLEPAPVIRCTQLARRPREEPEL